MLSKINRLRKKKDFESLWKLGRVMNSQTLSIRYRLNNLDTTRIGIVIGTKVNKLATLRNKSRRRISEAIRQEFLSNIKKGLDIAIIGRSGIIKKNYQEIIQELDFLFRKTGILA